jgi:hypothetical protein
MRDRNIQLIEAMESEALDLDATNSDAEEDCSFDITLDKRGHDGGFHTANQPDAPYQRKTITERRGPVDIRCKSREVVHGDFGPESDDFATLLVYDFHFDAMKRFRRVARGSITFEFSSSVAGAPAPEVHAIAPFGRYSLQQTSQEESYTREGSVNADVGQMGASLGGSYSWSKTVNRTTTHDTRVVGVTICNGYGKDVGVNWVLHENDATKAGVPSFLRTAILLKRAQDQPFQCEVRIDIEADWKTEMTRFFGVKGKDDPVLFDPELPPTNNLRRAYDTGNLGAIQVGDLFDATIQTTFNGAVKAHVQPDE